MAQSENDSPRVEFITSQEIDDLKLEPVTASQMKKDSKLEAYKASEVDDFLDRASASVAAMQDYIDALVAKLKEYKERVQVAEQEAAAAQAQLAQLREQGAAGMTMPASAPQLDVSASERQISQVLIVAQQAADKMREDAKAAADKTKSDADKQARKIIQEALAEKQGELDEIDRLKTSREEFRKEYKKLLQHFMDDADSVFPEQSLDSLNGSSAHAKASYAPVPAPEPVPAPAPEPAPATNPFGPAKVDVDFSDLD